MMKTIAIAGVALAGATGYTQEEIQALKGKTWSNKEEVLLALDFANGNERVNPYPQNWSGETIYNTEIDMERDCYVEYTSEARDAYSTLTLSPEEAVARNETGDLKGLIFKSHDNACGACSSLDDLATYLEVTDLTTPVRECGLFFQQSRALQCLRDVGFEETCAWIWYWNTINTKAQEGDGGCFLTCIAYVTSPNIEPEEDPRWGSPCNPNECNTQINGVPTCTPDMYVNGSDTRLNACLQCDECRSGPLFQKIAARTRRGSGIRSAIDRDEGAICEDCYHGHGQQ